MYPLHKYVPTPFGTYLMYINHGKERVTVENIPKDVKNLKKQLGRNSKLFREKEKSEKSLLQDGGTKKSSSTLREPDIRPSYQIHFLEHTGQTIREPPPNIVIVDGITGADVTTSATWIRNRPQRWKERLKLHEIENPKMTSTIKETPVPTTQHRDELLRTQQLLQERQVRTIDHPPKPPKVDLARSAMLPHISKQPIPRRGREKREEREREARKRRRHVDKIMDIVANRAQIARMKSQNSPDKLFEVNETKTSKYFSNKDNLFDHRRSVSVEPRLTTKSSRRYDEVNRSASELSHNELRSRATVREEKKPPKIQDWNPREEHQALNRIVLERLEATMPYKWQERNEDIISEPQPQYHYVL